MLRVALFACVLSGGAVIFEAWGLFPRDEAWLVAGLVSAVVLFLIPEAKKSRDTSDLIFTWIAIVGLYGIALKFRPWLGKVIDPWLAALITFF